MIANTYLHAHAQRIEAKPPRCTPSLTKETANVEDPWNMAESRKLTLHVVNVGAGLANIIEVDEDKSGTLYCIQYY